MTDLLPIHKIALCKAALMNTVMMCQGHMGNRSHTTAADIRTYEACWKLLETNFTNPNMEHPTSGDFIPQTQEQNDVPAAVVMLEGTAETHATD